MIIEQPPAMHFPETQASIHTLPNGLVVILEEDHSAPVISVQGWVETGSIHEGEFLGSGLSHLLEHMVFKGTESYDGGRLSELVHNSGGQWNAYTTFDRTVYYIDGVAQSWKTYLEVLAELIFKPTFPKDEFEKEKEVIRREIDMGVDDPDDQNSRLLYSTAFLYDARRHPVIGHLELFNSLSHEDMLLYHRRRYTSENVFLSVSGDFNTKEMLEHLNKIFSSIVRKPTSSPSLSVEPAQMGMRLRRENFSIPASKLNLAWQVPGLEHPDAPCFDLLSIILGVGRSSRLYRTAREELGLCHEISTWSMTPPQLGGLFGVSAIVETSNRDRLQEIIVSEVKKTSQEDLTDEISKAKRMVYSSQIKTLTTASGRATDLASNWNEARNLNFTKDYLEKISKIRVEDLHRVVQDFLSTKDNLSITSLDPVESEEKTTKKKNTKKQGEIVLSTLDNGLTLVLQQDTRLPTISLTMASLTGLPSESYETSGKNALLARLFMKGTKQRSAEQIARSLDSLGASFGVSFGNNTTLGQASCLESDFRTTLEIVAEIMQNPLLPEDAINRERETMISSLKEQKEDPLSLAFLKTRSLIFGKNGYGLNGQGRQKSLSSLTRGQLLSHHRDYFSGANSVISIFGDIDLDATKDLAEKVFSKMPIGERANIAEEQKPKRKNSEISLDKRQAVLVLGFEGASIHDEDHYALELIHNYCSDMAGPLFTKIREEKGLAYYVSATQFLGVHEGMFAFYLGTAPEQLAAAKDILLGEVNAISKEGIPKEKLDSVKNSWLSSYALGNQKITSRSRLSALDSLFGFAPDHSLQAEKKIQDLTSEQISEVANKYFAHGEPCLVTVSPEKN